MIADRPPPGSSRRLAWLGFFATAAIAQSALVAGGWPDIAHWVPLVVLGWLGSQSLVYWSFADGYTGLPCRVQSDAHVDLLLPDSGADWRMIHGIPVVLLAFAGVIGHALFVGPPMTEVLPGVAQLVKTPLYLAGVWYHLLPDGAVRHMRFTSWGLTTRVLRTAGGVHAGAIEGRPAPFLVTPTAEERGFPFAQLADIRLVGHTLELVDEGGPVDRLDLSRVPEAARDDLMGELTARWERARAGVVDDPASARARREAVAGLVPR